MKINGQHGTSTGYKLHRARRERACDPCREYMKVAKMRSRGVLYTDSGYDPEDGLGEGAWVLDAASGIRRWVDAHSLKEAS